MQQASEKHGKQRIDHGQAVAHGPFKSREQLGLQLGIARLDDVNPRRAMIHDFKRVDPRQRFAQRGAGDEIRADGSLHLAVVTLDSARAFSEADGGERGERYAAAAGRWHPQLLQDLQIAACLFLQENPDRHDAVTRVVFCKRRADIADGRVIPHEEVVAQLREEIERFNKPDT